MARAVERTSARRDFIIHYAYLAEKAGIERARRFRQAVETGLAPRSPIVNNVVMVAQARPAVFLLLAFTLRAQEPWDFTPANYKALKDAGKDVAFDADSDWFPQKYKDNLLATLKWALSSDRKPPVTEGVNVKDFYHGHVVCPLPCKFDDAFEKARKQYSTDDGALGQPTAENLQQYIQKVKAAEQSAKAMLTELCRQSDKCSIIYHTFEYKSPSDGAIKCGDPRRNIKTDFSDKKPAPYSPPDVNNASSYDQNYCHVFQFAFLVDKDGKSTCSGLRGGWRRRVETDLSRNLGSPPGRRKPT